MSLHLRPSQAPPCHLIFPHIVIIVLSNIHIIVITVIIVIIVTNVIIVFSNIHIIVIIVFHPILFDIVTIINIFPTSQIPISSFEAVSLVFFLLLISGFGFPRQ